MVPAPLIIYPNEFPYRRTKVYTAEEQEVIFSGFPYVDTRTLQRGDRLERHQHSSVNTHRIVKGSLTIIFPTGGNGWGRRTVGPGMYVEIPAGREYRAEAGDQGCVFVEGHTALSPTTRLRFETAHGF